MTHGQPVARRQELLQVFHGLVYARGVCFINRGHLLQNAPKDFNVPMTLAPDITDLLARARADLRMGVPVVLGSEVGILVLSAETLDPERLSDVMALSL